MLGCPIKLLQVRLQEFGKMIKLKSLLTETLVFPGDFTKEIKRAEKATGKKFKVPSSTKKLCMMAKKDGFHKLAYLHKLLIHFPLQ